jgi:hypothetical protein
LLNLIGLLGVSVLEDQGINISVASDLELDVVGLGGLLDAGSYIRNRKSAFRYFILWYAPKQSS